MSTRTLSIDICTCGHSAGEHRLWVASRFVPKDYIRGDYEPDGKKDCMNGDCQCTKFVDIEELAQSGI